MFKAIKVALVAIVFSACVGCTGWEFHGIYDDLANKFKKSEPDMVVEETQYSDEMNRLVEYRTELERLHTDGVMGDKEYVANVNVFKTAVNNYMMDEEYADLEASLKRTIGRYEGK